jgi:hypothetical protein
MGVLQALRALVGPAKDDSAEAGLSGDLDEVLQGSRPVEEDIQVEEIEEGKD